MSRLSTLFIAFLLPLAYTAPTGLNTRDGLTSTTPTPLSNTALDNDVQRPAFFSRVAYCSSAAVTSWTCGAPCEALGPGIEVLSAGGDDGLIPMYFIAHDPATQSIVVAHQGTDAHSILSILNDAQFGLVDINATRFPGASSDVQVHDGFQKTFERTADGVLSGVQDGLKAKNVSKVLVTGHSLGAAIATLDSVFLKQNLNDPSIEVSTKVFGLPRTGNQAWADLVDATLPGNALTHVTNQNDPVPTVPPRFLGFQHPQGEVHIQAVDANGDATDVVSCDGQENENCSEGNSLFSASVANHLGPYFDDISFGGKACPL